MQRKGIVILVVILAVIGVGTFLYLRFHTEKRDQTPYASADLGIETILSDNDKDQDGVDDYTDILLGARAYIETNPKYKSKYYENGYPDDGYGVCTDVIWNAFMAAGYSLKDLLDTDVEENLSAYSTIETPDPNIDFRRVKNLKLFFERKATSLTTDFSNPEEWQAGDIVVFTNHIAICSDIRNKEGIPFIIHHDSKGAREQNDMETYEIVGHYRWE